jgi:hypothetical protein
LPVEVREVRTADFLAHEPFASHIVKAQLRRNTSQYTPAATSWRNPLPGGGPIDSRIHFRHQTESDLQWILPTA